MQENYKKHRENVWVRDRDWTHARDKTWPVPYQLRYDVILMKIGEIQVKHVYKYSVN